MVWNAAARDADKGREAHGGRRPAVDAAVADMPPFDLEAFVDDVVNLAEWRWDRGATAWAAR